MGKELSVTKVRMYEELLNQEFYPIIKVLQARNEAMRDRITIEVKRDLGVYDLILKQASLKAQLDEVTETIEKKTKARWVEVDGEKKWLTPVEQEIERRLNGENAMFVEAKSYRDGLVKQIKLSICTPEIRSMFSKLEGDIADWKAKVAKLPAPKLKPLSQLDLKVLGRNGGSNGG